MRTRRKILGQLLIEAGHLDQEELRHALGPGRRSGERLGETLVRLRRVRSDDIAQALAAQLGLPYAARPLAASPEALSAVEASLSRDRCVLPLAVGAKELTIAMADPLDISAVDDIQFQTGRRVRAVVASPDAVRAGIDDFYSVSVAALVEALPRELRTTEPITPDRLATVTRRAPVVRLVDHILKGAVDEGASDIHLEETGGDVRVRVRIDGILRQRADLPAAARRAVLSRLKVIAGMDISVRRRAQDGRVSLEHGGRTLTLRVSTLPVNGGETAVVRILDSESAPRSLSGLGMAARDLRAVRRMVERGEGVILAAGPTGSGKSTTLFAALSEVDRCTNNVVTLEDPIEYRLPGSNQVQVDPRAGLDFAAALRAILRQDPDVVMVGEIRDRETAEIAMAAAVTGHLVLSTIHTTDAPGAVTRLLNMGVPPFLVSGGLAGVLAQRLVRRRCHVCRGAGCGECDAGCRGRTGIYQVLEMSDELRDEVGRGGSSSALRRLASRAGMGTLASDARRALASGLTTPHEAAKLIRAAEDARDPCACGATVPLDALGCPWCGARTRNRCECGGTLERDWSHCPWCVRPVAA